MLFLSVISSGLYFSFIAYVLRGLAQDFIRYRETINYLEFAKSQEAANEPPDPSQ